MTMNAPQRFLLSGAKMKLKRGETRSGLAMERNASVQAVVIFIQCVRTEGSSESAAGSSTRKLCVNDDDEVLQASTVSSCGRELANASYKCFRQQSANDED
jgi:hypothetical protein